VKVSVGRPGSLRWASVMTKSRETGSTADLGITLSWPHPREKQKKGKCTHKLREFTRNSQGTPAPNSSSRPLLPKKKKRKRKVHSLYHH
jgi:hypothetical protein